MKAYPIILSPCEDGGYVVTIPDFDINTEGDNLAEAIFMARDAMGLWAICEQDMGRAVPEPNTAPLSTEPGDIVNYVDIDIDAYRREVDTTTERANVSLPRNLKAKAKAAGLNLSQELQTRLREVLNVA